MKTNISVFVRNETQYHIVKKYNITDIYTDQLSLAQKYPEIYYQMPRTNAKKSSLPNRLLVNNTGVMMKQQGKKEMIGDYFLNIANITSIKLFSQYVSKMTLSIEYPKDEINLLKEYASEIEVFLYGRVEVMLLKSHPIFTKNGYELKDNEGHFYPVRVKGEKHVHIFHYEPLNRLSDLVEYQREGITNFRIDFFDETPEEIETILSQVTE